MARIVVGVAVRCGKMKIRLRRDRSSTDSVREENLTRDLFQVLIDLLQTAGKQQDFDVAVSGDG